MRVSTPAPVLSVCRGPRGLQMARLALTLALVLAACADSADEAESTPATGPGVNGPDEAGGEPPTGFSAVAQGMFGAIAGMVGETVVVSVLDEDAKPLPGARVTAELGTGWSVGARAIAPGQFELNGLLDDDVVIRAELAGGALRIRHPTDSPKATLIFPVGGEVVVYWVLPERDRIAAGELRLVLQARGDTRVRIEQAVDGSVPAGFVELPYLRPGEYEASLELWEVPLGAPNRKVIIPVTAPRVVRVSSHERSWVRLGVESTGAGAGDQAEGLGADVVVRPLK